MIWTLPTIMTSKLAGVDSNARTFLNAIGSTDTTINPAINKLVQVAKANGWWSICTLIYPYVGGTSSSCAVNLKSPGTNDITYHGGLTFASTGVTGNGTTGYADTTLNINTLGANSAHISFYSRTDNLIFGYDMGAYDNSTTPNTGVIISLQENANVPPTAMEATITNRGGGVGPSGARTDGWFLASRITSTDFVFYRNAVSLASSSVLNSSTNPSLSLFAHARNLNNGTAGNFTNREYAFITAGAGINSTITSLMYSDILNFQTMLGRQV